MIPTVAAQQRSRSNFHETQNADGALRVHPASGRPFFRGAPRGSAVRGGLLPPGRGSGGPNPQHYCQRGRGEPDPRQPDDLCAGGEKLHRGPGHRPERVGIFLWSLRAIVPAAAAWWRRNSFSFLRVPSWSFVPLRGYLFILRAPSWIESRRFLPLVRNAG